VFGHILFLLAFQAPIFPEDHGIYIANGISSVNKLGENWLICGTPSDTLLVFSPDGERLAILAGRGQGPGELYFPYVLGVEPEKIIVANMDGRVFALDHHLQLVESLRLPRLGQVLGTTMWAGFRAGERDYVAVAFSSVVAPLVKRLGLGEDAWQVHGEYFPQKLTRDVMRQKKVSGAAASSVSCHNGWFFYQTEKLQEPRYKIAAYQFPKLDEGQKVMTFANQVGGFEPRYGIYAGVYKAARFDEGWVLEVSVGKNGEAIHLHDYFDANGKFLKRIEQTGEVKMHPALNDPAVFLWNGDGDRAVLKRFQPDWTTPK